MSSRLVYVLSLFLIGLGCASVEHSEQPKFNKEVKDVSHTARREDAGPRKRLMVLPFLDSQEGRPQALRDKAREEFLREMNQKYEIVVVDSSDLKMDFSKSIKSGEYDLAAISKQAQQLGVAAILEGKLIDLKVGRKSDPVGMFRQMKTKFEASVRVRIAATRSGRELFNTVKTVTLEEAQVRVGENVNADKLLQSNPELLEKLVSDAFLDFGPQIQATLDRLSWEGRIAMISGDRIFLNVGRISGLQIGDIVKVSDDGDEVYDPQSGNYIGRVPGRLKGTLEVVSYFGQDGAIAVIHSGAGFKENDKIELY
ncbi:MAG: hypothetical protein BroJett041_23720 [Candidatus Jettenia caeni]|nr:MAG: hypothetical protein BroJett041_23720 [Candidatus Jettenia caeni]